jgi:hypothetical protein
MGFLALIVTQSKSTTLFFWCGLDISYYLHQGLWCLESNIKFSHYSAYISSFVFIHDFLELVIPIISFICMLGLWMVAKKFSNWIKGVQIYLDCYLQQHLTLTSATVARSAFETSIHVNLQMLNEHDRIITVVDNFTHKNLNWKFETN